MAMLVSQQSNLLISGTLLHGRFDADSIECDPQPCNTNDVHPGSFMRGTNYHQDGLDSSHSAIEEQPHSREKAWPTIATSEGRCSMMEVINRLQGLLAQQLNASHRVKEQLSSLVGKLESEVQDLRLQLRQAEEHLNEKDSYLQYYLELYKAERQQRRLNGLLGEMQLLFERPHQSQEECSRPTITTPVSRITQCHHCNEYANSDQTHAYGSSGPTGSCYYQATQQSVQQIILDGVARKLRHPIEQQPQLRTELGDRLCSYLLARSQKEHIMDEQQTDLYESMAVTGIPIRQQVHSQVNRTSQLHIVSFLRMILQQILEQLDRTDVNPLIGLEISESMLQRVLDVAHELLDTLCSSSSTQSQITLTSLTSSQDEQNAPKAQGPAAMQRGQFVRKNCQVELYQQIKELKEILDRIKERVKDHSKSHATAKPVFQRQQKKQLHPQESELGDITVPLLPSISMLNRQQSQITESQQERFVKTLLGIPLAIVKARSNFLQTLNSMKASSSDKLRREQIGRVLDEAVTELETNSLIPEPPIEIGAPAKERLIELSEAITVLCKQIVVAKRENNRLRTKDQDVKAENQLLNDKLQMNQFTIQQLAKENLKLQNDAKKTDKILRQIARQLLNQFEERRKDFGYIKGMRDYDPSSQDYQSLKTRLKLTANQLITEPIPVIEGCFAQYPMFDEIRVSLHSLMKEYLIEIQDNSEHIDESRESERRLIEQQRKFDCFYERFKEKEAQLHQRIIILRRSQRALMEENEEVKQRLIKLKDDLQDKSDLLRHALMQNQKHTRLKSRKYTQQEPMPSSCPRTPKKQKQVLFNNTVTSSRGFISNFPKPYVATLQKVLDDQLPPGMRISPKKIAYVMEDILDDLKDQQPPLHYSPESFQVSGINLLSDHETVRIIDTAKVSEEYLPDGWSEKDKPTLVSRCYNLGAIWQKLHEKCLTDNNGEEEVDSNRLRGYMATINMLKLMKQRGGLRLALKQLRSFKPKLSSRAPSKDRSSV